MREKKASENATAHMVDTKLAPNNLFKVLMASKTQSYNALMELLKISLK